MKVLGFIRFNPRIIFFAIFSILVLVPFIFDKSVVKQNDLNGGIVEPLFLKQSILKDHEFPYWNSYINQGIPFVADPLNSYLFLPSQLTFFIFPTDASVKIIYVLSIFASASFAYLLLKRLRIGETTSTLLALTYAVSGYLVARISAGHFEKILSYPLLPLFLISLMLVLKKQSILNVGLAAIVLSLILFTGDLYNSIYSIIILVVIFLFYLLKSTKKSLYILFISPLFLLFSSIKIFPMYEALGYIGKTKEPLEGSQNIISIIYYLFFPVKNFFSFTGIESYITTAFGWWEKISFIGPVIFIGVVIFLLYFKKIKSDYKLVFLILSAVFILLSSPTLPLLKYFIGKSEFLSYFHVPSRTFAYLSLFLITLSSLAFNHIKNKRIVISLLFFNLIMVVCFFEAVLSMKQFNNISSGYAVLLNKVTSDDKPYYIGQRLLYSHLPQEVALKNNQKLLESNYGFQLKDSPARNYTKYDFENYSYNDIIPKYVIVPSDIAPLSTKDAQFIARSSGLNLYTLTKNTPYASLTNGKVISTKIEVNKITVSTESTGEGRLTILESSYPGWRVYVNNKQKPLVENKLLTLNTQRGANTYKFIYAPNYFFEGLAVSVISITLWLVIVLRRSLLKALHKIQKLY